MFFILQRFIEIINDLGLLLKTVNRASVPTDKSGESQKDTLEDDLLLL
jgi:hypothetical protein